jgi:putative transcriptional regulator
MPDPRFAKTVVYIWRHDVSGAAGVIINKRCEKPTFKHVCEESKLSRKETSNPPVHYGGPILNNIVGVLHSTDFVLPSTNTLTAMGNDGPIGFTLDRKMLEIIAQGQGPLNRLVTLGMANWETGQLEEELEHPRNPAMSWLVLDYDEKIVFGQLAEDKPDEIWEECVSKAVRNKTQEITAKVFKD